MKGSRRGGKGAKDLRGLFLNGFDREDFVSRQDARTQRDNNELF
ncbi:hypothetical protein A33Q_1579 [Indibacter alkaliphilus LW1]|uniref:Uncharacterized protein n=1 Tax=Indibacter alkaliphilus (strain CCUG 57479 / KCTC 22604 / LW1) TaxID=1189612 RepID=S2DFN4_INDAL|nr:hypothetical protein A33Q_1579 [Indibacter alkaliphilus LW1]